MKLPFTMIREESSSEQMDAVSSATEGFLGQRIVPDAVSGASAI
ncbi:hypothetical protein [Streptococcus cameli]